jgi:hypothetical protein
MVLTIAFSKSLHDLFNLWKHILVIFLFIGKILNYLVFLAIRDQWLYCWVI